MDKTNADFGGYVTKAGLKCSDGRTITAEAFKHMDGQTVPLVWQHGHDAPTNVLGHMLLEHREDGVYGYGFFNDTDHGIHAKKMVAHKDINRLSIYANQLVEKAKSVLHGFIKEASLVISGANPGAMIDFVRVAHSDGDIETLEDEAIIFTGLELQHGEEIGQNESDPPKTDPPAVIEHADEDSLKKVYDTLNEDQQLLVHYMVSEAARLSGVQHSDDDIAIVDNEDGTRTVTVGDTTVAHLDSEGNPVGRSNVFEAHGTNKDGEAEKHTLSHADMGIILGRAQELGSMKAAVEEHGLKHGIENLDLLFPEATVVGGERPEWVSRRMEWVAGVLNGTRKTPFSRIKTRSADITHDEARARGYITGEMKKEEYFGISQRTTTPTTIYKKQRLDRDDIIDITDFDIVAWMKEEMRVMLDEELARAVLIGDGRAVDDPDKIRDPMGAPAGDGIRSILHDHELFVTTITVDMDDTTPDYNDVAEDVLRAQVHYKGSGTPTFYTTYAVMVEMLLSKDLQGKRRWNNQAELAGALGVRNIVTVEVMEGADAEAEHPLLGIIVNLNDYVLGADRGGQVSMFDDFDIDYNQYKYLIETRCSGALVKLKSAIVVRRAAAGSVPIVPLTPAYNPATGVITIPTQTGTTYSADGVSQTDGATVTVPAGESVIVTAEPDSGRHFADNASDAWEYNRPPA